MQPAAVSEAYDRVSALYVELFGRVEQLAPEDRTLIARWRDQTDGPLLDAGCGPGHWTQFLHDGTRDVIGVDLAADFVRTAKRRFPAVPFVNGSINHLPVGCGSLGGILAWYSLIHAAPGTLPGVLAGFAQALRPAGGLLLGFFDGEPGRRFDHAVAPAYYWSPAAMTEMLLKAGFTVTEHEQRHDDGHRPHAAIMAVRQ